MKKSNIILLSLLLLTGSLLNACATKPITQQYPERWDKTYVGMSLEEFNKIWPEAKGPFADVNNNIIFIFSPPVVPFSLQIIKSTYFTFLDNNLVSFSER